MDFTISVEGGYCLELPSFWQFLEKDLKNFALQNNISDENVEKYFIPFGHVTNQSIRLAIDW
jgi:hypothetical protein